MAADWDKMALIHVLIGYEADILGIITFTITPNWKWSHTCQALLIVAFVLYTIASVLLAGAKLSGSSINVPISIVAMICTFVAAVFLVIGVGVYDSNNIPIPYAATLEISAAFLAFLAFTYLIVHLCCRGTSRQVTQTSA